MCKSRLSESKQQRLIELFISGSTARTAAALIGVNKNTAAYYFHRLRQLSYQAVEDETLFSGEIEVDESYFGGSRKGKRGRGAAGKIPVFGTLKRAGKGMGAVTNITRVRFSVGELVHPQLFDYRGVIVDVGRNFQRTVE